MDQQAFRMNHDNNGAITAILDFLKTSRRMDCSGYRPSMILRRINHRMLKTKCSELVNYLHLIRENSEELDFLMDAMTINVTRFFRDTLVFEYIADKILPAILSGKQELKKGSLRVWSAGCASGEETFSAAILIAELFRKEKKSLPLFIFGTDISKKTLGKAREGSYDFESVKNMKYRLIKQYFIEKENGRYQMVPEIKNLVLFSNYNMLDEESFVPSESIYGNFDLVFCRNLLIYFGAETQDTIFSKLYRSLAPGGYLVLGESETPSRSFKGRFRKVTDCCHIYQKIAMGFQGEKNNLYKAESKHKGT